MSLPIEKLHRYPVNPRELLAALQRSQQALSQVQRCVADNLTPQDAVRRIGAADVYLASIQGSGPNGENDYSDSRYWLQLSDPSPFSNPAARSGKAHYSKDGTGIEELQVIDKNTGARSTWVTATNLSEFANNTHLMGPGDIVVVCGFPDPVDPLKKWYAFTGVFTQTDLGEIQYQVKQMVSDNQAGWDFVRAHPLP